MYTGRVVVKVKMANILKLTSLLYVFVGTDFALARPKSASCPVKTLLDFTMALIMLTDLKFSALIDKEVLWFEIPVQNSPCMAVGQTSQHLRW